MLTVELERFILEDLGEDDDSTGIVPPVAASANIVCKEDGVLAGLDEALQVFEYFGLSLESHYADGNPIKAGDVIMTITGDAADILRGERLALNFLGRMSGIATLTRRCVSRAGNARIAATRKTTPGFRSFEKKAVKLGGGDTHRYDLSAAVMIKDNHIAIMGIEGAIAAAKKAASFTKKIEIEVESVEDGEKAASLGADIIMFDNMAPDRIAEGVARVKKINPRVIVEASGGITMNNIGDYARAGVDVISLGALTRDAKWLDFSLDMETSK
ncbi:carboxylating nicotinate-nucleotide diphosphorylase [Methanocella arvoryzae]|uniref:Nicotinate-nucleotide pyrophosphorylase [carboxylating] n=1 Tax=Methanocella arvoryzae (strain DSM 22066 / NBRC 105507 / MRE50) TaxID=351160 RepID=Q0W7E1_METAR|nr:carboxylating nicotinate-nucleotide diphosphorylase [Methanocella arvoryzae]CAJ35702.1 nicotinate-nucleotide pyrophosphorylase [Methanocella arvoryzae MRE50]